LNESNVPVKKESIKIETKNKELNDSPVNNKQNALAMSDSSVNSKQNALALNDSTTNNKHLNDSNSNPKNQSLNKQPSEEKDESNNALKLVKKDLIGQKTAKVENNEKANFSNKNNLIVNDSLAHQTNSNQEIGVAHKEEDKSVPHNNEPLIKEKSEPENKVHEKFSNKSKLNDFPNNPDLKEDNSEKIEGDFLA